MMSAKEHIDLSGLNHLIRKSPELFKEALEKPALQMLTWMNTGSSKESRTPPIKTGVLRGSGSAFVSGKLIGTTKQGEGTPATTPQGMKGISVHWVYNTDYAAKMHEWGEKPHQGWGEYTKQAKDAGNKWMSLHVNADGKAFAEFTAKEFRKLLNKEPSI